MAPQLYLTMYKEHFASPGRTKREPLRPTSAHRRNNPQPRPDFLFPRSLQPSYKSHRTTPHPKTPVDSGRPLFPPVGYPSFHSPVTTCPDNHPNTVEPDHTPNHTPPVFNPSSLPALPPADGVQKLQLTKPPAGPAFQFNSALKTPMRKNTQLQRRPQTGNPLAPQHLFLQTQYRRSSSSSILDYSGCYSCFHVVKPYQAGHYIIHPEFVSECLR
ncbi:uncharacterized protein LOC115583855 [Xyrichtys novacula]|uniref:Uncharacterized protein LOC115583855 n=1 Tax=Xyrichtys novacula TaxID=13765 RepID=A0AAV1ERZ8_XYRNO|nr:uncharacterized protein LOC115583855 [Xyrichtys novacula]